MIQYCLTTLKNLIDWLISHGKITNNVNELKHNFSNKKNKNINDLNKEFKEFVIHKKWKILSNTLKDIDTNSDTDTDTDNNTTIDNENNSEWEKVDNKEISENNQDNSSWTSWLF